MNKKVELLKNSTILFIGTFFTKVIQYFLLPIYTSYLSTKEYGEYDLFNTIISLLIPIIGLQIEQGTFRFLTSNRNNENRKKNIISSSFAFILLSFMIVIILYLFFEKYINNCYKSLVLINLFLSCFSSYLLQISRGFGDNKNYSISNFLISISTIIFNIIFLLAIGLKVDGMLYGSIIGYCIGIIYLFLKLRVYKYLNYKYISNQELKKILDYSLPLIPFNLSYWVFTFSDRFIVSIILGLSSTGLLSVSYKFSNIIIAIYNVFNMSLIESMSLHINDNDIEDYFNDVFKKISIVFTSLGSLIIVFLPWIFNLLINNSFEKSYNLIAIAIIAANFQIYASLLSSIYFAKNRTKSIAITSFGAAIINIIVHLILINYIGLYASVISTVVSYVALFIFRFININKNSFKIIIDSKLIITNLLFIFNLLLFYCNSHILDTVNLIITIFCLLFLNNDNIKSIKILIKKHTKTY